MEEKKLFIIPEAIIVDFGIKDIITSSGDKPEWYDPDKDDFYNS